MQAASHAYIPGCALSHSLTPFLTAQPVPSITPQSSGNIPLSSLRLLPQSSQRRRLKKGEERERHITQEEVIFTNDPPVPTDRPTERPRDRPTAAASNGSGEKEERRREGESENEMAAAVSATVEGGRRRRRRRRSSSSAFLPFELS